MTLMCQIRRTKHPVAGFRVDTQPIYVCFVMSSPIQKSGQAWQLDVFCVSGWPVPFTRCHCSYAYYETTGNCQDGDGRKVYLLKDSAIGDCDDSKTRKGFWISKFHLGTCRLILCSMREFDGHSYFVHFSTKDWSTVIFGYNLAAFNAFLCATCSWADSFADCRWCHFQRGIFKQRAGWSYELAPKMQGWLVSVWWVMRVRLD